MKAGFCCQEGCTKRKGHELASPTLEPSSAVSILEFIDRGTELQRLPRRMHVTVMSQNGNMHNCITCIVPTAHFMLQCPSFPKNVQPFREIISISTSNHRRKEYWEWDRIYITKLHALIISMANNNRKDSYIKPQRTTHLTYTTEVFIILENAVSSQKTTMQCLWIL